MDATLLKLELMYYGVYIDSSALHSICNLEGITVFYKSFTIFDGVIIKISNIYVNTPVQNDANSTRYSLVYTNNSFRLLDSNSSYDVEILLPPPFAVQNTTYNSIPIKKYVMFQSDRMRISPIRGCAYNCHFCSRVNSEYEKIDLNTLSSMVDIAYSENINHVRHFMIGGGTPKHCREDYLYMNDIYAYFPRKYSNIEFDVMLTPRTYIPGNNNLQGYISLLKFLYDSGIQSLAANMEIYDNNISAKLIPQKHAIGNENYMHFLENAVHIFGKNKVRSALIVGLEPANSTLRGIQELVSRGVIPMLSPFLPFSDTQLISHNRPSISECYDIILRAHEIADKSGLFLGPECRPCTHNCLTVENV